MKVCVCYVNKTDVDKSDVHLLTEFICLFLVVIGYY